MVEEEMGLNDLESLLEDDADTEDVDDADENSDYGEDEDEIEMDSYDDKDYDF